MNFISNYFTKRELKKINKIVKKINKLEPKFENMNDEELRNMTRLFKSDLDKGLKLNDILPEAFAVVREASKRVLGMRHYDVQLIGGVILHQGKIAEMKTGEGKTLVATAPVYLNALTGKGVHVITVNDYLAMRDKVQMSKLYSFLGLTTGVIVSGQDHETKKSQYSCDITYGTNNEFGFDYLRDNMVSSPEEKVQRELNFTIVDEVDSILVDEARTPLIISSSSDKSTELYYIADTFTKTLDKENDFSIDEKYKAISLNDCGITKAETFFGINDLMDMSHTELQHHINKALRANYIMKKDVDYIIHEDKILIIDEFTGRIMYGRMYSDGLHQAIEAKEGLEIQKESKTMATITFQNYFRLYDKLSGMTGTAKTEEEEFKSIYKIGVTQIPTNKPIKRVDLPDIIYKTKDGKTRSIIKDIEEKHKKGQPVLVGTISIEDSEHLSSELKKKGIKHNVLNAKYHREEAGIIAQAGRFKGVTIATNMAGRGTDIILGGNPEILAKENLKSRHGYQEEDIKLLDLPDDIDDEHILTIKKLYKEELEVSKKQTEEEQKRVIAVGGLCVIGTERHESRRIDNQLRGRSGRQGDPGESKFYISLEDDLMRIFGGDRMKNMVDMLGMDEDTPLEHSMLSKTIEKAQKKVEGMHFGTRKQVVEYDDVINKQREIIYKQRRSIVFADDIKEEIENIIYSVVLDVVNKATNNTDNPKNWDLDGLEKHLYSLYLPEKSLNFYNVKMDRDSLVDYIYDVSLKIYSEKDKIYSSELMRHFEKDMLLSIVDYKWIDHIDSMDQLKQGIGLRAIGQENPVRAYQIEGFELFNEMSKSIQYEVVAYIYNAKFEPIEVQ